MIAPIVWFSRLRGLFAGHRHPQGDPRIQDEIASHIELLAADFERRGMSPDQSRLEAQRQFGGASQVAETWRDQRGLPIVETFAKDVRYALRQLIVNPGFAVAAVVTLSLGIGANTAIFRVLDAVVLRSLPLRNPEQLVNPPRHEQWKSGVQLPAVPRDGRSPDRGAGHVRHRQEGVLMVQTRLDFSSFRALRGLDTQPIYERLNAIPGVRSAALAGLGPFSTITGGAKIALPERLPLPSDDIRSVSVSPRYFETMGIAILAGRPITEDDRAGTAKVAVISQTAARAIFGASKPVGRYFSQGQRFDRTAAIRIVGVAHDIRFSNPRDPFGMILYQPLSQSPLPLSSMALRTGGAPALFAAAARRAIEETAPVLKIAAIQPLEELLGSKAGQERMMALLSGAFGLLALVLASVGLYGVIAYGVEGRTQEIGIRLALGARPGEVTCLLLREVAVVLALGLAIGGAAAMALGRSLAGLLFGLTPHDPAMLIGSAALLSTVAFAAGYLPARRAARLDPMNALRQE